MTARIYVGTYAKYNDGNLAGAWLDLEDYTDREAFLEACAELHKDEADPELMFQDYECFPSHWYAESSAPPQELWDWLELSEHDQTLLEVYKDNVNQDGDIEEAREAFRGTAESKSDFAHDYHDECGELKDVPESLRYHIDWDSVARDMDFIFVDVGLREVWAFDRN